MSISVFSARATDMAVSWAFKLIVSACLLSATSGYLVPAPKQARQQSNHVKQPSSAGVKPSLWLSRLGFLLTPAALMVATGSIAPGAAWSQASNEFKIERGAASTLNTGTVKTITRGVSIDNADFESKDLSGVSFQQSLIRQGKFKGANLEGASFFDADLSGADFTGANMNNVNLELSNLKDAILKDAIVTGAYISGATRLTNVQIDGADFTETMLRKDQQKYLCARATGTNPTTGVETVVSLLCP